MPARCASFTIVHPRALRMRRMTSPNRTASGEIVIDRGICF
jgi:hypothetical protein